MLFPLNIFYFPYPCNRERGGGGVAVDDWGEYYDENYRKTGEENRSKEGRRNRKKEWIVESLREEKNTQWIRGDGTGKE